jgi:hypothetical protein
MNVNFLEAAPALLTAEQAASLAGVSHPTIIRSSLPRYRTRRGDKTRTYFHRDDVAAFRGNVRSRQPKSWPSQGGGKAA